MFRQFCHARETRHIPATCSTWPEREIRLNFLFGSAQTRLGTNRGVPAHLGFSFGREAAALIVCRGISIRIRPAVKTASSYTPMMLGRNFHFGVQHHRA